MFAKHASVESESLAYRRLKHLFGRHNGILVWLIMVYIAHTLALLCQSEHLPTEALIFDLFQTYKFLRFTLHIFSVVFGSNTTEFDQLPQTLSGWFAARFHLFSRAQQGFTRSAGATCWWRRNTLQLPSCSIFACPPQNFQFQCIRVEIPYGCVWPQLSDLKEKSNLTTASNNFANLRLATPPTKVASWE